MSSGCFLEVISDVRCFLAFSIIARVVYFYEKKGNNILIYLVLMIIACLIHSACVPIAIFWVLYCLFLKSNQSFAKKLFNSFLLISITVVIFVFFNSYIISSLNRALLYLNNDIYSYFWEYLIGVLYLLLCISIMYSIKKQVKACKKYYGLYQFAVVMLIISTLFIWEYNIFHRYITFTLMIMLPLICNFVNLSKPKLALFGGTLRREVMIISMFILFIACARGNLCGYKFFKL